MLLLLLLDILWTMRSMLSILSLELSPSMPAATAVRVANKSIPHLAFVGLVIVLPTVFFTDTVVGCSTLFLVVVGMVAAAAPAIVFVAVAVTGVLTAVLLRKTARVGKMLRKGFESSKDTDKRLSESFLWQPVWPFAGCEWEAKAGMRELGTACRVSVPADGVNRRKRRWELKRLVDAVIGPLPALPPGPAPSVRLDAALERVEYCACATAHGRLIGCVSTGKRRFWVSGCVGNVLEGCPTKGGTSSEYCASTCSWLIGCVSASK